MSAALASAWQGLLASSILELAGMLLAIAYLLLAVRQNILCWAAAFVSTALYTWVFLGARLYMDAGLQVFYMAMAVYGFSQWRQHADPSRNLKISTRSPGWHLSVIAVTVLLSLVSGYLLARHTQASFPYLDSLTTWASVVTTWMVARKVLENWTYWIVIDTVSVGIYVAKDLYLTVILFSLYVVIAFAGWRRWHRDYLVQETMQGSASAWTGAGSGGRDNARAARP